MQFRAPRVHRQRTVRCASTVPAAPLVAARVADACEEDPLGTSPSAMPQSMSSLYPNLGPCTHVGAVRISLGQLPAAGSHTRGCSLEPRRGQTGETWAMVGGRPCFQGRMVSRTLFQVKPRVGHGLRCRTAAQAQQRTRITVLVNVWLDKTEFREGSLSM